MFLKTFFAASTLAFCTQAGAQSGAQVFKCKDTAGKITYASKACNEIGLSSAGDVKGDINMIPATKPAPAPVARPAAQATAPTPKKPASDQAADDDGRRCFSVTKMVTTTKVVKTPKGNQTVTSTNPVKQQRCNDDPEEAK